MGKRPYLYLSRLTGQPVVTPDRVRIGRLVDMTVLLDIEHPVVHRVAIGSGRRIRYLVPWRVAREFTEPQFTLAADRAAMAQYRVDRRPPLEDKELFLCRDVLDTQVVDLAGQRLARVSDVLMTRHPDDEVAIDAVDVGLGSLLRRMGLARLGASLGPVAVDWEDLHLTSSRGHLVQLSTSTTGMHTLDARGLAELLARISTDKAADVIRTVGPERSAEALQASHPILRRRLVQSLAPDDVQEVIAAAPPATARHLAELRRTDVPPGRRLLRTAGWRIYRPPGPDGGNGQ
jgi:sporulation protein YlmC with PRC-barrel domain